MIKGLMVVMNGISGDSRVQKMSVAMARFCDVTVQVGIYATSKRGALPVSEKIGGVNRVRFPIYTGSETSETDGDAEVRALAIQLRRIELFEEQVAEYAREFSPDLVHTHDMYTLPIGGRLKADAERQGRAVSWVHDVHESASGSTHIAQTLQGLALDYEREYLKVADQIVTVTPALRMELKQLYPDLGPIEVIYNTPRVHPRMGDFVGTLREELNIGSRPLAVYSGNVKPFRGLERMIPVLKESPETHLALLTNSRSAYTLQLVDEAKSAGVGDRLHWHPYVDPGQVVGFLRGADVGVIPFENYGNAEVSLPTKLFEYLFAGIPVLANDLEALADFLTLWPLVGQVTNFDDPVEAARDLEDCIQGGYSIELERLLPSLTRQYAWEVQERRLLELYMQITNLDNARVLDSVTRLEFPKQDIRVLHGVSGAAGQPATLARSLDQVRGFSARSVLMSSNPFAYGSDFFYPLSDSSVPSLAELLRSVGDNFDVFHLHFRSFFHDPRNLRFPTLMDLLALKAADKRIVFHFRGSEARLQSVFREKSPFHYVDEGEPSVEKFPERQKQRFIALISAVADRVLVPDPEIAGYVPGSEIVERAVNLTSWKFIGIPETKRPLVIHAPSRRRVKGTEWVLEAVSSLKSQGVAFDFELVENMSQSQAREVYERADVVIDQLRIGWFGVFAVEAMALGKPVIAFIRDDLLPHFHGELPLANANPETIQDVLKRLLLSQSDRERLSNLGRAYVERHHDSNVVAEKLAHLYSDVVRNPRPVELNPVIDHIVYQASCRTADLPPVSATPPTATPPTATPPTATPPPSSLTAIWTGRLKRFRGSMRTRGVTATFRLLIRKVIFQIRRRVLG